MARKNKKQQTRLTFEPVTDSSSQNQSTPANVRYVQGPGASSSPSRASLSTQTTRTPGRPKNVQGRQQKITGQQYSASPTKPPTASFMPEIHNSKNRPIADDFPDNSAAEADDAGLVKSSQSVSTRLQRTTIDEEEEEEEEDDDDDDDDDEPVAPPSTLKRRRHVVNLVSDSEDDDDRPLIPLGWSKSSHLKSVVLEDSSDGDVSPAKKNKTSQATPSRLKRPILAASSPTKRGPSRAHRSERQKKMELLRRRRAGEKIDRLTSSEDESDQEKRGIYDTDSEEELKALKEFEDESESGLEEVLQPSRKQKESTKRSRENRIGRDEDDENGEDLDDFVTDDEDPPANLDIPLQFTAQAHRPLKEQFPFVIAWLVHRRVNPAFDRDDPVYQIAWKKLGQEVDTLASSKFASSIWKSEFYRALKGRPNIDSFESYYDHDSEDEKVCEACGRKGHRATFLIHFHGHAYYKDSLDDVESDSEESDSDGDDHKSTNSQGMVLPPETKIWEVGATCQINAERAHSLLHWKHALKEWVEERLEDDGWMEAHKLKQRENLKVKKRRKLADSIVDGWHEKGIIAKLYREFEHNLEASRSWKPGQDHPRLQLPSSMLGQH
ncbi:hypothetical protein GGR54DRAFT_613815 [Hypoxylon sp. NC1633]|nr:hypothetical protein GGR54DRAFT_613815 [Hypoxylon sp. NC1633]